MSLNSVSIPFIIFLIATFDIASGLKCYSCVHFNKEGAMNPSCKNPTPGETPTERNATLEKALHSRTKKDTGKARQNARDICALLVGTFNGYDGVIRIKSEPTTLPNGCEKAQEYVADFNVEFVGQGCLCDTDLCNGSDDPASYVKGSSGRMLPIGLITSAGILLTCLA